MKPIRSVVAAVATAGLALLAPAAPAAGASEHAPAPVATDAPAAQGSSVVAPRMAPTARDAEASAPEATEAAAPEEPVKTPTLGFLVAQGGLWSSDIPQDAGGELRTVTGSEAAPREADEVISLRVEVETGIGVNGQEFARQVMATLNDARGWGHDGSVVFERAPGPADADLVLASPATTDELCAPLETEGEVSCAIDGRAIINAERWAHGAEPFLEAGGTLAEYRRYLVNHEVGHLLDHGHVPCPEPGAAAPVMLQQTLWLHGCVPNGWPAATD